jgi:hypothetical protein
LSDLEFQPNLALGALVRHGVKFVLIGGLSARAHGSPRITNDLDICYARDDENLNRLAAALKELGARLRGAPQDVPLLLDARTLKAGDHFTFVTRGGGLDCLGTPAGSSGFDALDRNASTMKIFGLEIRVASLNDLIEMKLAAGRPKDLSDVEDLGALRDVIEENDE